MVAGIPGTSIGGLFYILLAFMMPVKEAYISWQGKSSVRRWLHVVLQMVNAAGIIASIWGTGWVLGLIIKKTQAFGWGRDCPSQFTNLMSITNACFALAILALVLISVLTMSLVMPKRPAKSSLAELDK